MSETHQVFVYGTLRHDLRKIHDKWPHVPKGKFISTGSIKAALYSLGSFPTVKLEGDTKVVGEVVLVNDEELKAFDRLEGHPHMYTRHQVKVTTPFGKMGAWVYEYNGRVRPESLVSSGDWADQYEASLGN